ncbi:unnamed protein product, partial [Prorocentrum cordatum]
RIGKSLKILLSVPHDTAADLKAAYRVPIVYTYTEDASASVKPMLQASVLSALQHMPGMALHLLYHGSADIGFRDWLEAHGVIL